MISYGYWQRRFGGEPGRRRPRPDLVDSRPSEIVGGMPEGFDIGNSAPDVIAPIGFNRGALMLPGFGLPASAG